jgi:hypothetical protein
MGLIDALYILAVVLMLLFFLTIAAEIWLWWYPGFAVRAKRARRHARFGR